MPFDPTKPADASHGSAAEIRSQLQALHADIQGRAILSDTSHNCSSVQTFAEQGISFSDSENQQLASKIDELISVLRR